MNQHGFEHTYRMRKRPSWHRLAGPAVWVFLVLLRVTSPGPAGRTDAAVLVLLTGIVLVTVVQALRGATVVGPDGITTRGAIRQHRLAWAEIYDIRLESPAGGPVRYPAPWVVRIYDRTGRRYRLPNVDGEQLDSPADAEAIRIAWTAERGPEWVASPESEAGILWWAARRKAWERAAFAALFCALGLFVASIALIFKDMVVPTCLLLLVPGAVFAVTGAVLDPRARVRAGRRGGGENPATRPDRGD